MIPRITDYYEQPRRIRKRELVWIALTVALGFIYLA